MYSATLAVSKHYHNPVQSTYPGQPGQTGQTGHDFEEIVVLEALGVTVCFRKHFGGVKTLPRGQNR